MKKLNIIAALSLGLLLTGCGTTQYAITMTGENLSSLTKVTDNEEPCISPYGGDNGKDLFFAARENMYYYNIYKKENPFSNAMSQKTSGKNYNISPAYCAAIDKIAFQGKALSQITESIDAYEMDPCFSSDGKYLVYSKVPSAYYYYSERYGEIWLRNLQTGENILLGNGVQPSFSPNNERIVYSKFSADAGSCSIWTMKLDGSDPVQLTDAKKGYAYHPRYSPDGKKIVFDCYKKDKKDNDIYIIDADGNNMTQVTINNSYDGQPYWTTDGYIYFVSDRGGKSGNRQIWRFKL